MSSHAAKYRRLRQIAFAALDAQAKINASDPLYCALRVAIASQDELVKFLIEFIEFTADNMRLLDTADADVRSMLRLQVAMNERTVKAIQALQAAQRPADADDADWWKRHQPEE